MDGRVTRPLHLNMAETTAHPEGGPGPDQEARTTDTKKTIENQHSQSVEVPAPHCTLDGHKLTKN